MLHSDFTRQSLLTIHLIGLAFGLGGAGVADFFFFHALRQGDMITPNTVKRMRAISSLVWVGIALLGVSGAGLFFIDPSKYMSSPGFLAKMVVVLIVIINGLFLNFYTTARLTTFNFSSIYTKRDSAWRVRKLSFVFGAISAVSWYSALLIAQFKDIVLLPFWAYIGLYIVATGFAIGGSLFLEMLLYTRVKNRPMTLERLSTASPAEIAAMKQEIMTRGSTQNQVPAAPTVAATVPSVAVATTNTPPQVR
jgi:uncharacterized membrane protein